MPWIIFAFGSVFFFTFENLLQRVLAINSKNARAMAILFNITAALIALAIFLISGSNKSFVLPSNPSAWITVLIACVCYGMFERGRFYAAKLLDVSVYTVISNISVVVAFTGSIFLYSERLTPGKLLGAVLIITALLLVSVYKKIKKVSLRGTILAMAIWTILGLGWMLDKRGTQFFTANVYYVLTWWLPLIFIIFPLEKFSVIKSELKTGSWKIFLLAGINVFGYILQLKALELTEATKVIPIVQTYTLLTVFLGILFLKERENIIRKIIAGILAIVGVYLLM